MERKMKSMKRRLNSLPQFSTSDSTQENSGMPSFGIVQLLISARTINNKNLSTVSTVLSEKSPRTKFVQNTDSFLFY
jgi:hypothetical protein